MNLNKLLPALGVIAIIHMDAAMAQASLPHVELDVALDPVAHRLAVKGTIRAPAGQQPFVFEVTDQAHLAPDALVLPPSSRERSLDFQYTLALSALISMDHRETLGDVAPIADAKGSFLPASSVWHPTPRQGPFTYRLRLTTPPDQRGLVPGHIENESVSSTHYEARFVFVQPAQGIDLMAGPYLISEKRVGTAPGVLLRTYFHPELKDLSADYLDSSARYIEKYSREIGPYPYGEFSIVSSPTPTGFGMPSLTYLGIDVLRLPFIRHTSLGHEVLHNWWGNGIYVDYASGNWCEGLTAFMADYAFKEQEGPDAARATRLAWLRDLSALPISDTQTLRSFVARTHGASQIVGYHKASMLFQTLRTRLGAETFNAALRWFWTQHRFQVASWADLKTAFEETSGQSLGTFFTQYVERADLPDVHVQQATLGADATLSVTLVQSSPAYELVVPIHLHGKHGTTAQIVTMTSTKQTFQISGAQGIERVSLDDDLQMLRKLDPAELPAILRQVMIASQVQLVVPEEDASLTTLAMQLAGKVLDNAPTSVQPTVSGTFPALIVGTHAAIDRMLVSIDQSRPHSVQRMASAQVWAANAPGHGSLMIISVQDEAALRALLRPLPHYGSQSYLVFEGGKAVDKGVWASTPLSYAVAH